MDLSGSMQGAGGVGGLLAVNDGTSSYYPTYDGNGNVSEYLDSTNAVQAHYEYDAFGNITVATGTKKDDFSHRFSTKPLDAETGLYYYGYRYYDPNVGRFVNRDPIQENGGENLYGFVGNDSINRLDVLGLLQRFFTEGEAISAALSAVVAETKASVARGKKRYPPPVSADDAKGGYIDGIAAAAGATAHQLKQGIAIHSSADHAAYIDHEGLYITYGVEHYSFVCCKEFPDGKNYFFTNPTRGNLLEKESIKKGILGIFNPREDTIEFAKNSGCSIVVHSHNVESYCYISFLDRLYHDEGSPGLSDADRQFADEHGLEIIAGTENGSSVPYQGK